MSRVRGRKRAHKGFRLQGQFVPFQRGIRLRHDRAPAPMVTSPSAKTAVRITTLNVAAPVTLRKPMHPE